MNTMSTSSHPRAFISAAVIGKGWTGPVCGRTGSVVSISPNRGPSRMGSRLDIDVQEREEQSFILGVLSAAVRANLADLSPKSAEFGQLLQQGLADVSAI